MSYELPIGWLLDLVLGDPARLPHPVVAFGKWISLGERWLNRGNHCKAKGALLAVSSVAGVFLMVWALLRWLEPYPWVHTGAEAVLVFYCLAGRTLRHEVSEVFVALHRGLTEGRRQVARIVGRDTENLSAQEVRTAALETLAENLSDGVVAPLFWYMLLGVPGMVAYKMVNTLDSMLGYRTPRYHEFGMWAARQDDIANLVPARVTALFMLLAYKLSTPFRTQRSMRHLLAFVFRYGRCHASPNSGWPEAALAACLDCRFGGTHSYFGQSFPKPHIGSNPRKITDADLSVSIRICLLAELFAVVLAVVL